MAEDVNAQLNRVKKGRAYMSDKPARCLSFSHLFVSKRQRHQLAYAVYHIDVLFAV